MLGIPMHFRPGAWSITACGLVGKWFRMTKDISKVDCLRCKKTHAYKYAKSQEQRNVKDSNIT